MDPLTLLPPSESSESLDNSNNNTPMTALIRTSLRRSTPGFEIPSVPPTKPVTDATQLCSVSLFGIAEHHEVVAKRVITEGKLLYLL